MKPSDYEANIRARFLSASCEEVEKGVLWYRQAHGLARLLAGVAGCSTESAAGVLAALSPMNRWEDNVSDAFAMARSVEAVVRTPGPNRFKAARILAGEHPRAVLGGKKVLAFWEGIARPTTSQVIAVDRHLYRGAIDRDVWFRAAAPDPWEFDNIEAAYLAVAQSFQLPPTAVAAVVWLVMRRAPQEGQRGLDMRHTECWRHEPFLWPGKVSPDPRGRLKIYLSLSHSPVDGWREVEHAMGNGRKVPAWVHPAASSGGWAWLPRFIVWQATGEALRSDEHVHHTCLHRWCVNPAHYEVGLAEYHGRLHASFTVLRDGAGRFAERTDPYEMPEVRFGPIIGQAAVGAVSW